MCAAQYYAAAATAGATPRAPVIRFLLENSSSCDRQFAKRIGWLEALLGRPIKLAAGRFRTEMMLLPGHGGVEDTVLRLGTQTLKWRNPKDAGVTDGLAFQSDDGRTWLVNLYLGQDANTVDNEMQVALYHNRKMFPPERPRFRIDLAKLATAQTASRQVPNPASEAAVRRAYTPSSGTGYVVERYTTSWMC